MARGFGAVRQAAAEVEARKQAAQAAMNAPRVDYFKLDPGQSGVVRFLEQGDEVAGAYCCQLPPPPGRQWGRWVPSRDQAGDGSVACPMMEMGMRRSYRGWINLIHRDAPIFQRDEKGRVKRDASGKLIVIGNENRVRVWEVGINAFTDLGLVDERYGGIGSRDFIVTRSGTGNQTRYSFAPAEVDGGPQPMSAEDKLLADAKYDLTPFITPESYEKLLERIGGQRAMQPQQIATTPSSEFNPFEDRR